MGIITVSIDDEIENKLRKLALAKFGKMKGSLSNLIEEAVEDLSQRESQELIIKGIELLEKGVNMGGMISKKREDWHRR